MIIGVTGKKRSGKDTVANYLVDSWGFKRYGFADPMKKMVKEAFLWDDERVDGSEKETIDPRWGISPRQALQHIGTEYAQYSLPDNFPEFKKLINRKLWVKRFKFWYEKEINETNKYNLKHNFNTTLDVVVSDVRFLHEVQELKGMGGIILRVNRPEANNAEDPHPSETEMDSIKPHFTLDNEGTFNVLYKKIDQVLRKLGIEDY